MFAMVGTVHQCVFTHGDLHVMIHKKKKYEDTRCCCLLRIAAEDVRILVQAAEDVRILVHDNARRRSFDNPPARTFRSLLPQHEFCKSECTSYCLEPNHVENGVDSGCGVKFLRTKSEHTVWEMTSAGRISSFNPRLQRISARCKVHH